MTPEQIQQYRSLIKRVITRMGMYSEKAEDLVLGTGLYESQYRYIRQIGSGIAKSFWQVEWRTTAVFYRVIWWESYGDWSTRFL